MKRKTVVLPLMAGIVILVAASIVLSLLADSGSAATTFVNEYSISGSPHRVVVESPGRVWVTMPQANAIGYLVITSPSTHSFTTYPVPTSNSEPYDLVYDGTYIWFTERAGNKLGRLNVATKNITEFTIPQANQGPTGIDVAPNGRIWFTAKNGNRVYRFNPNTSLFTAFSYSGQAANAQPEDIAVLGDDAIWFTAPGVNRVVKLTPSTNDFLNVSVLLTPGGATFPPGAVAVDSSNPWISAPTMGLIGRHAPGTLAFWRWYSLPTSGASPTDIFYRSAGGLNQIWFVETDDGRMGHLATDANGELVYVREFALASNSQPTGIVVDANGHAWVASSGNNKIVEWLPPYFHFTYLPVVLKP